MFLSAAQPSDPYFSVHKRIRLAGTCLLLRCPLIIQIVWPRSFGERRARPCTVLPVVSSRVTYVRTRRHARVQAHATDSACVFSPSRSLPLGSLPFSHAGGAFCPSYVSTCIHHASFRSELISFRRGDRNLFNNRLVIYDDACRILESKIEINGGILDKEGWLVVIRGKIASISDGNSLSQR